MGLNSIMVTNPPSNEATILLPNRDGTQHNHYQSSVQEKLPRITNFSKLKAKRHVSESPEDLDVPPMSAVTAKLHSRVFTFLSETHDPSTLLYRVQQQTWTSLSVIREALSRYTLSELSLSYNGGKDCLVLLILFLASLHLLPSPTDDSNNCNCNGNHNKPHNSRNKSIPTSIPAIYVQPPQPFSSVESFVHSTSRTYHLSLTQYTYSPPSTTLRSTFASYLSLHPQIRAIFVGTRRTDPHGANLTHFDRTDHGWPDFVRIHPVIDWHYAEIWAFIRHLGIEYCPLYNQGYTSLGGSNDTHPNPKLRVKVNSNNTANGDNSNVDDDNDRDTMTPSYRPAYELTDDDEERLGRD